MSKTVTLRVDDQVYRLWRTAAERDNRPLANFIETAVLRFVEEHGAADEFEMAEIRGNRALNRSMRRGVRDARARRGRLV